MLLTEKYTYLRHLFLSHARLDKEGLLVKPKILVIPDVAGWALERAAD